LGGANLARAELCRANLSEANLESANFEEADLSEAKLSEAYLYRANLCGANLQYADLRGTCLIGADIRGADLRECTLVDTNLEYADLSGSSVFGVSAWRLNLKETTQKNLVISQYNEPEVKVDSLEIAQLLYWLLYNENIYTIIDKITSKLVIISGHFIAERKPIFKVLQSELHQHGLTPILLDFEETAEKVANTTIHTLANIARFVIADITNPRTIPGSMLSFIEGLPSIPVQPIKNRASDLWLAYERIQKKSWVLPLYQYQDVDDLLTNFTKEIIEPAEQKMLILQAAAGSAHSKRSK
ncbi:MAG: hypothetical protein GWN62_36040, partial [Aliifodinibius sp.]|nr:hypothetical protein [Fodinibius sp.]NIW80320.1 hypothetical protein [Calditrichia bacterium]